MASLTQPGRVPTPPPVAPPPPPPPPPAPPAARDHRRAEAAGRRRRAATRRGEDDRRRPQDRRGVEDLHAARERIPRDQLRAQRAREARHGLELLRQSEVRRRIRPPRHDRADARQSGRAGKDLRLRERAQDVPARSQRRVHLRRGKQPPRARRLADVSRRADLRRVVSAEDRHREDLRQRLARDLDVDRAAHAARHARVPAVDLLERARRLDRQSHPHRRRRQVAGDGDDREHGRRADSGSGSKGMGSW